MTADSASLPPVGDAALDIETFARISAALMEGVPVEDALARHRLAASHWETERGRITRAIAEEAMQSDATPLGDAYAEALVRARDQLAPVPEMTPEQWATLAAEAATQGTGPCLRSRGLTEATYLRLCGHWTRVLSSDRSIALRYAASFARASRGP